MQRDEAAYLFDMLIAAQEAKEFASGLTFQKFTQSRLHQKAILKSIEIVGEAATHITEETRLAHPEVPWKKIIRYAEPPCAWLFPSGFGTGVEYCTTGHS